MIESETVILVVGMHRSGTSVVAGLLSALGVSLGASLLEATEYNPTGHFEDKDLLRVHKSIFRAARGDWDCPPDERALYQSATNRSKEIREILERKRSKGRIWGWKEPRTTLLLPVYKEILGSFRLIYCVRDATEVARSLVSRNGLTTSAAVALKRTYDDAVTSFVNRNPSIPVLTINYHDLRTTPDAVVEAIIAFLDLDVGETARKAAASGVLSKEALLERAGGISSQRRLLGRALRRPWRIFPELFWRLKRRAWKQAWNARNRPS